MNTDFELSDEMEMPTPCSKCNKWFDLNDGMGSEKWYPNTVICEKCGLEEAIEMEQDEEIEDLKNAMSDAEITIRDCKERLRELKVPPYYFSNSDIRTMAEDFAEKYLPKAEYKICGNCAGSNCVNNKTCIRCNSQF